MDADPRDIASLLRSGVSIPAETVRLWMNLPDLNVQGLAFGLLFDHLEKVEGSMSDEERDAFFLRYLEQCLRDPADGEYAYERYMAGDALRAWFQRLWKRRPDTEHTLISIREMLRRACLEGDAATRDAVITAVLEHLFVNADVAAFFRSWERDARLREIYKEAIYLASSMQ
ncbi:hypothetical protein [Roseiflexus sp.]